MVAFVPLTREESAIACVRPTAVGEMRSSTVGLTIDAVVDHFSILLRHGRYQRHHVRAAALRPFRNFQSTCYHLDWSGVERAEAAIKHIVPQAGSNASSPSDALFPPTSGPQLAKLISVILS